MKEQIILQDGSWMKFEVFKLYKINKFDKMLQKIIKYYKNITK